MISLYSTEFLLKLKIEDDKRLENNEIFRIIAVPPELPDGFSPCTADIIILDNDGKLLHKILFAVYMQIIFYGFLEYIHN